MHHWDNPRLASIWGAAHAGIEDELLREEDDRLNFIRFFKPIMDTVFDTSEIWKIPILKIDKRKENGKWKEVLVVTKILEEPNLKSIFK